MESTDTTRRQFLGTSVTALAAALLPHGSVLASDAPEVSEMRFGIIALTDCSPIVIAHEKGFFKKYGIHATVARERTGRPSATRSRPATTRPPTC